VYTYPLTDIQQAAVYNTTMGTSNLSVHITSSAPVTVYALNQHNVSTDATNILPVTALGTDYYQISYTPVYSDFLNPADAYAIVATQNTTQVFHNGTLVATLNTGQVYYRTLPLSDMTGTHITTDKPVAYFTVNQVALIPATESAADCLFEQLPPVNTWGKNFFVPVSHRQRDIVRIVASQNGTNITLSGGALLTPTPAGGQSTLNNLNAGQWIEILVPITDNGCFVSSNHPVGVCTYLTGSIFSPIRPSDNESDPAQAWLPAIEQMGHSALVAPFIPNGTTALNKHYALIITPTATQQNTTVSIGGTTPVALSGGTWYNHTSGYSFYSMPLTDTAAAYLFSNQAGLIVMGYGVGSFESYYYLAASAMRTLDVAFYVNDIHYQDLPFDTLCVQPVPFRAEIAGNMSTNAGHLKWYIDNVEETAAQDQFTWSKYLPAGAYQIKMETLMEDNITTKTAEALMTVSCGMAIDTVSICQGDSALFGNQYYKLKGIYYDTLTTDLGFDSVVALYLSVNSPSTGVDTAAICLGDSITINGHIYAKAGIYQDTLKNATANGCDSIVTLTLTVNPAPIIRAIADSSRITAGKQVQLSVEASELYHYLWDNADLVSDITAQNPTAIIQAPTQFTVVATDPVTDCKTKDSVFVDAINLACNKDMVYIPNAFTPNGDGINDIFRVRSENLLSGTLMVFDRWGNKVFESADLTQGWDGAYKGKQQQVESYGYYFSGVCVNGETVVVKGSVTVLE
jgi:gliding motility-associated-like protein